MKVLMLQDTKNYAGTEAHILTLSTALSDLGSVNVELLVPKGSELEQRCKFSGTRCHVCNSNPVLFFFNLLFHVRKLRPDIIHAHNGRTILFSIIVSKLFGGKVVATQHFLEPAHISVIGPIGKLKRAVHQWVGRQLDFRICVSNAALTCMKQRGDSIAKSDELERVIYTGVLTKERNQATRDLNRQSLCEEWHLPHDAILLLAATRLELEKSVDVLIKAVAPVCFHHQELYVLIAGEGTQRNNLESIVESYGIANHIQFLGFRSDIVDLMASSDIFVLSSSVESFGLVIIEAMSQRVPVIAPNAGGPKEVVAHGHSGMLFETGNVTSLMSTIECLVIDRPLRSRLATNGYYHATTMFSVSRMAVETLSAYTKVLTGQFVD
jgi:glycosyltransferase involved in cell wall biosynthesis